MKTGGPGSQPFRPGPDHVLDQDMRCPLAPAPELGDRLQNCFRGFLGKTEDPERTRARTDARTQTRTDTDAKPGIGLTSSLLTE